jgi:carbon-monoxide dehydrogenase iron sulfur subunit
MTHLGIFNPRKALLRIEMDRSSTVASQIDVPVVCQQCDPAPCEEACPEGAIEKTAWGAWRVDKERCTGCGSCVDACQYGIILMESGSEQYARKCDLCGGEPACVEYCPMKALAL